MRSLLAVNDAAAGDLLLPGDVLRLPEGADIVGAASVRLDAGPYTHSTLPPDHPA